MIRIYCRCNVTYCTTTRSIELLEHEFGKGARARPLQMIVDNATQFRWLYELAHKSHILEALTRIYEKFKTQLGSQIRFIKSDNETAIRKSKDFDKWVDGRGIHVDWTQKGTSEQNGTECAIENCAE